VKIKYKEGLPGNKRNKGTRVGNNRFLREFKQNICTKLMHLKRGEIHVSLAWSWWCGTTQD
jgi:hypothetical protein